MHASPAEWLIIPSRQQRWLDAGLALLLLMLFLTSLNGHWLWFAVLPACLMFVALVHTADPMRLGVDRDGWWIQREGQEQTRVNWAAGSIRRRRMLLLAWGFWPWQVIRVRADSLRDPEQFRYLKYCLYGSV